MDFVYNVRDNQPTPLTKQRLLDFLNSTEMRATTAAIRRWGEDRERLKRNLPGVTWQSEFNGLRRQDGNARATSFFCLDVDLHHSVRHKELTATSGPEEATTWAKTQARQLAKEWADVAWRQLNGMEQEDFGILGVCVSPSGTGLHVIGIRLGEEPIADSQRRLASQLGTEYDVACKDMARIFFLSPMEDWTFLDLSTLFAEEDGMLEVIYYNQPK